MNRILTAGLAATALALAGCATTPSPRHGSTPAAHPFAGRTDAVFSPAGSVPPDASAVSPDGTRRARELAPAGSGWIGIFGADDAPLLRIRAQEVENDPKAIAWSPDGLTLAVLYHGGAPAGVSIYDAADGTLLRTIPVAGFPHFLAYASDGRSLLAAETADGPVAVIPLREGSFAANVGVNLPWVNYGWDVGEHPWGGSHGGFSSDRRALEETFSALAAAGVRVARVFLLCDLRSGVRFAPDGTPAGVDDRLDADLAALLATAERTGIRLVPVLLDYTIADGTGEENGVAVGDHPDILADPVRGEALLRVLRPVLRRYAGHPAVLAWDLFNEPDNISIVPEPAVDAFLARLAHLVRSSSRKAKITIGARSAANLGRWRGIGADIVQFHHFDEPEALPDAPEVRSLAGASADTPVLVGECPPSNPAATLSRARAAGHAGCLFWSWNADNGRTFKETIRILKPWTAAH